jgi:ketosteroid isomerase-like protein
LAKNPAEETVLSFVERINAHDNGAIFALKTDDFVFVDSGGSRFERSRMNWDDYFRMFPDYVIRVDEVLSRGDTVVILGSFSQTYTEDGLLREENRNTVPAAWRAEVRGGRVSFWQVYTDHTRTWAIINRSRDRSEEDSDA